MPALSMTHSMFYLVHVSGCVFHDNIKNAPKNKHTHPEKALGKTLSVSLKGPLKLKENNSGNQIKQTFKKQRIVKKFLRVLYYLLFAECHKYFVTYLQHFLIVQL